MFDHVQDKNIKHSGNLKLNDIIEIARVMAPRSCAKELSGTCKEILGTCVSVGCTVEGAHPSGMITKVRWLTHRDLSITTASHMNTRCSMYRISSVLSHVGGLSISVLEVQSPLVRSRVLYE